MMFSLFHSFQLVSCLGSSPSFGIHMPKDEVFPAQAGCLCIITPHGGNGAQRGNMGI